MRSEAAAAAPAASRVLGSRLAAAWVVASWMACLAAACADDTYVPIVICHNANCEEPTDPSADDTLPALEASLALRDADGRPLIDGVELDTFWVGEEERCVFAHDLNHGLDLPDAADAMAEVAAHISDTDRRTRTADHFWVFVEMKGHVGAAKTTKHTPAQRAAHATCVFDMIDQLPGGRDVSVMIDSFDPQLLAAIAANERFASLVAWPELDVQLGGISGIPKPLDSQSQPTDAFSTDLPIDMMLVNPQWLGRAEAHAYDTRGWDLGFWMFSATVETLDAIDTMQPRWVVTSEAATFHRWLRRDSSAN